MNAPTRTPVEPQQTPAVRHCLHLIGRVFDVNPTGFDWPCSCGKPGSQCTQKEDGSCG